MRMNFLILFFAANHPCRGFQPLPSAGAVCPGTGPCATVALAGTSAGSQRQLDNHANHMNPYNVACWSSRGEEHGDDDDDYEYSQAELDNHADQMNPNNDAYWSSRGEDYDDNDDDDYEYSQEELDNHADQMNPNNDEYWNSRG